MRKPVQDEFRVSVYGESDEAMQHVFNLSITCSNRFTWRAMHVQKWCIRYINHGNIILIDGHVFTVKSYHKMTEIIPKSTDVYKE